MLSFVLDFLSQHLVSRLSYLKDTGSFTSEMLVTRALNVSKRLPWLMHTLKKMHEFEKYSRALKSVCVF